MTATVSGAALTLTAVRPGAATVTVTASDPEGLTAIQTFTAAATSLRSRAVVEDTLAAMGRGHLASARATLGRRVAAPAEEATRLTLAGQRVPLGLEQAAEVAARLAKQEPRYRGAGPTEFLVAFGSQDEEAESRRRWTIWGQGDLQTFEGGSGAATFDGDLRTGYLGVDTRFGEHWLAGLAATRSSGAADWRSGAADGRLDTTVTSVQPYLRWSNGNTTLWAMAGAGRGSADNERTTFGIQESSSLDLGLGLAELRQRLGSVGGLRLELRGDASWARLSTGSGEELLDGIEVLVFQGRLGLDLGYTVTTGGGTLIEPFGAVHGRQDGGDGQTGSGLEVAGGLRVAHGSLRLEGVGRMLALHSAESYQERGAAVTVSVGEGARRPGLTVSLSPRWGASATASEALWQEHVYRARATGTAGDGRAVDARAAYGLRLPAGQLLTPFWVYGQSEFHRRLAVGVEWSSLEALGVELAGERTSRPDLGGDDYRVSVLGSIGFGGER